MAWSPAVVLGTYARVCCSDSRQAAGRVREPVHWLGRWRSRMKSGRSRFCFRAVRQGKPGQCWSSRRGVPGPGPARHGTPVGAPGCSWRPGTGLSCVSPAPQNSR